MGPATRHRHDVVKALAHRIRVRERAVDGIATDTAQPSIPVIDISGDDALAHGGALDERPPTLIASLSTGAPLELDPLLTELPSKRPRPSAEALRRAESAGQCLRREACSTVCARAGRDAVRTARRAEAALRDAASTRHAWARIGGRRFGSDPGRSTTTARVLGGGCEALRARLLASFAMHHIARVRAALRFATWLARHGDVVASLLGAFLALAPAVHGAEVRRRDRIPAVQAGLMHVSLPRDARGPTLGTSGLSTPEDQSGDVFSCQGGYGSRGITVVIG